MSVGCKCRFGDLTAAGTCSSGAASVVKAPEKQTEAVVAELPFSVHTFTLVLLLC